MPLQNHIYSEEKETSAQEAKHEPTTKFNYLTLKEAQQNSEFWSVFETSFREQAARIIQNIWKIHRHSKILKPIQKKIGMGIQESLNQEITLKFLTEVKGEEYKEHAKCIQTGEFEKLNFDGDPEFVRNVYKALHLKEISIYQLATALSLYHVRKIFPENKLRRHLFSDKTGPFQPEKIYYALENQLQDLPNQFATVPENERSYFSINFSKAMEAIFFHSTVRDKKASFKFRPSFLEALKCYIQQQSFEDSEKELYSNYVDLLKTDQLAAQIKLSSMLVLSIAREYPQDCVVKTQDDVQHFHISTPFSILYEEAEFFRDLMRPSTEIPSFALSPDYDSKDRTSPILCMIIPTSAAMRAIQRCFHGSSMIYPRYNAGQISTRFIRELADKGNERPVELTHPNLPGHPGPHGYNLVRPFYTAFHDELHLWDIGVLLEEEQDLARYERQLLMRAKGFGMSKPIWALTDQDFKDPACRRRALKFSPHLTFFYSLEAKLAIIDLAGKNFWKQPDTLADNLLLLIDMIKNKEEWKKRLFNEYPEDIFKLSQEESPEARRIVRCGGETYAITPERSGHYDDFPHFQEAFQKVKQFLDNCPALPDCEESYKRYIVLYRLSSLPGAEMNCPDLNKILFWTKDNSGLKFKSGTSIDTLDPATLLERINLLSKWNAEKLFRNAFEHNDVAQLTQLTTSAQGPDIRLIDENASFFESENENTAFLSANSQQFYNQRKRKAANNDDQAQPLIGIQNAMQISMHTDQTKVDALNFISSRYTVANNQEKIDLIRAFILETARIRPIKKTTFIFHLFDTTAAYGETNSLKAFLKALENADANSKSAVADAVNIPWEPGVSAKKYMKILCPLLQSLEKNRLVTPKASFL